ncbi:MAG: hypothetical protein K0R54_265 [Clostridiaceae bacterium]|jgi:5-bromo-4-chloroindolyl phosphate hydrolysis protein|nr:hypothetical protein [Clostridiaceae bacterium]
MKKIFIIIGLILLIPLCLGLKILLFPVNTISQSVDTSYGVVNKTLDADNAIYNYEWFKEQEATIRVNLKNEEIAKEEWELFKSELPEDREKWSREDKQEESSLRNSYYALQKLTNLSMEDYNAKSEMANRSIFKDNLPSNLSRAFYAGQELTR